MSSYKCSKCKASTRLKTQCRRVTCVRFPYCWQHLRSILHLALKKSRIRGAGLGLFTLIPRNKGEFVAEYTGKFVSRKEFTNSQYISQYGVDYTKDLVLDAKNTQTAVGRYSNDCRSVNVLKRECRGTNARFVKDYKNKKINIKAVKRIPAGGEIFLDYGEHYWG